MIGASRSPNTRYHQYPPPTICFQPTDPLRERCVHLVVSSPTIVNRTGATAAPTCLSFPEWLTRIGEGFHQTGCVAARPSAPHPTKQILEMSIADRES